MKKKKNLRVVVYIVVGFFVILLALYAYANYMMHYSLLPNTNKFEHSAHYINPDKALLNKVFKVCDEYRVYQYYNTQELPYPKGKNGFRNYIYSHYENRNYTDSGYFNIRFIINCEGKAGRFIVHENNLDLEPIAFNRDLKAQLIKLTTHIKAWKPILINNERRDCFMYVSYRIENGEITEIIP